MATLQVSGLLPWIRPSAHTEVLRNAHSGAQVRAAREALPGRLLCWTGARRPPWLPWGPSGVYRFSESLSLPLDREPHEGLKGPRAVYPVAQSGWGRGGVALVSSPQPSVLTAACPLAAFGVVRWFPPPRVWGLPGGFHGVSVSPPPALVGFPFSEVPARSQPLSGHFLESRASPSKPGVVLGQC